MVSFLALLGVVGVYYANYLGATGMWGMSINNLAQIFPFPYMPAGIFFGIARLLIFILLGIYTFISVSKYIMHGKAHSRTTWLFFISSILNILWVYVTAHQMYIWSIIIIALLMVALAQILTRHKRRNAQNTLGWRTFGAYYGWVSMATTVLSLSMLIYLYNPTFALSALWTYIAVAIGFLVTIISRFRRRNPGALLLQFRALIGVLSAFLI